MAKTAELIKLGDDDVSVRVVRPDDTMSDPVDEVSDDKDVSLICPGCGNVAANTAGFNVHVGRKHPDHPEWKIGAAADKVKVSGRQRVQSDVPNVDLKIPSSKVKSRDIKRLKASIVDDFNPFMLTIVSQTGIPLELMHMEFMGKTLQSEVEFSDMQAEIIARGIVELNGTPVANTVVGMVTPILPYFFGLAAIVVVGLHAFKVFMIRQQIVPALMQMLPNAQQNGQPQTDGSSKSNTPNFV